MRHAESWLDEGVVADRSRSVCLMAAAKVPAVSLLVNVRGEALLLSRGASAQCVGFAWAPALTGAGCSPILPVFLRIGRGGGCDDRVDRAPPDQEFAALESRVFTGRTVRRVSG